MAEAKKHMNRHLRSARQWLTKAEEAFDQDHDVRGELDLLLAQAELQHVKEKKATRRWAFTYPLLRHGLAIVAAVFVAAAGLGGAYWFLHEQERAIPIPLAIEQQPIKAVLPEQSAPVSGKTSQQVPASAHHPTEELTPVRAVAVETTRPSAVKAKEAASPPKAVEAEAVETEAQLRPDEMHKLIRAAAKSLRGQE